MDVTPIDYVELARQMQASGALRRRPNTSFQPNAPLSQQPTAPVEQPQAPAQGPVDYVALAEQMQKARTLRQPSQTAPNVSQGGGVAPAPSQPPANAAQPSLEPWQAKPTAAGYALFDPYALGKTGRELGAARGYEWREGGDEDSRSGWWQNQMNNEGAMGMSRVSGGDDNDFSRVEGTPDERWYAQEKARQQAFADQLIPTIQKNRGDIWDAFSKSYKDKAAENLYKQWYGGANNVSGDLMGYDYKLPELAKAGYIPEGGRKLFQDAAGASSHFMIDAGRGYHPYSEAEIAANPNLLNTIGTFYDPEGNAAIGGVRSRPKGHGLGEFATMMPIILGSALTGGLGMMESAAGATLGGTGLTGSQLGGGLISGIANASGITPGLKG